MFVWPAGTLMLPCQGGGEKAAGLLAGMPGVVLVGDDTVHVASTRYEDRLRRDCPGPVLGPCVCHPRVTAGR
jgi:hypothetical protein